MTITEENYLKAIFQQSFQNSLPQPVGTNQLAQYLGVKPATANSMLKKLKEKNWISYEKYGKISLSKLGKAKAIMIVRKHRLWETFLHQTLGFTWDEVHEVAEELEHIQSEKLIDRLDQFLNYPVYDPHGDPIPNQKGEMISQPKRTLFDTAIGQQGKVVGVKDNSAQFLQYVGSLGLGINQQIRVVSRIPFDQTSVIEINGHRHSVSQKFCENIFVV